MKEIFGFKLETYNLGAIKRDTFRMHLDPARRILEHDLFLFYTRRDQPASIDAAVEETIGLDFPTYLSPAVLNIPILQHPYLYRTQGVHSKNSTILTTTSLNSQVRRDMVMIPGSPDQYYARKIKPYNLNEWDADILEKCRNLPKHVKEAMGLK